MEGSSVGIVTDEADFAGVSFPRYFLFIAAIMEPRSVTGRRPSWAGVRMLDRGEEGYGIYGGEHGREGLL